MVNTSAQSHVVSSALKVRA